jgi:hypothetical protein
MKTTAAIDQAIDPGIIKLEIVKLGIQNKPRKHIAD